MLLAFLQSLIDYCRSLCHSPDRLKDDVLDYALREHQFYNSNFDALDSKANGLMQFIGIVLGLSAFQSSVSGGIGTIRALALGLLAIALVLILAAWCVRDIPGIPSTLNVDQHVQENGADETRKILIKRLHESSTATREACKQKTKCLQWAFIAVIVGVALLIASMLHGQ